MELSEKAVYSSLTVLIHSQLDMFPTVFDNYRTTIMRDDGKSYDLLLWDTAGQVCEHTIR